MSCLIKIMRVKDMDEKGCVLEYNGRVYFIDKKDNNASKFTIGEYIPVLIVKELDKYGFVVTASSLSELYVDILKQSELELNNLYKVILNKEGYINNINNIIHNNSINISSIVIASQSLNILLDVVHSNTDKVTLNSTYGTKDTRDMFTKFVHVMKLLYMVDTYYSELVKYKNS